MLIQGGGQLRKEVAGMDTSEILQLLMLVISSISLGIYIATHKKK
jgi:hypothetical protein